MYYSCYKSLAKISLFLFFYYSEYAKKPEERADSFSGPQLSCGKFSRHFFERHVIQMCLHGAQVSLKTRVIPSVGRAAGCKAVDGPVKSQKRRGWAVMDTGHQGSISVWPVVQPVH